MKSRNRKLFDAFRKKRTTRMKRIIMWIKQLFRCKRCKQIMYIPSRWYNNTDRMATFEHIVDLECLERDQVRDFANLVLICNRCNNLKSKAKEISSPFHPLFNSYLKNKV